jgi:hypothetical protein
MRMLLVLAALVATGTPNVTKLILKPAQVGPGYVLFRMAGGAGVKNTVTLDLCGRTGYPSERLRATRLQVNYLKKKSLLGISNEVVTYEPGGAAQAMREVIHHADNCPNRPIDSGAPGLPPLTFTITRIHDTKLLKGALAVMVRVRGTVNGKKVDQISYAVYQRLGNVFSGTYSLSAEPNTPAQRILLLHAAEQSAQNLVHGNNTGSPTA